MMNAFVYLLLLVIGFMLVSLTYQLPAIAKASHEAGDDERHDQLSWYQGLVYAALLLVLVSAVAFTWQLVRDTPWEGHLMEWLNIVVRLLHITFGIAWIGASFYFVFLENALNRTKGLRDELAGNLWAVHGGGFYYLEKYKVAPKEIPRELHWFKYEAYFTWLSGFCLLFVVYYFNAKGMLIDPNVRALSPAAAIGIGVGSFVVAWMLYHLLCKTPLVRKGPLFGLVGLLLAVGFAWGYSQLFSARAAYIHFGAMLATLMAGNVFFIIIPAQKAMVSAAKKGLPLDPALGKFAGLRSLHNNYLTLPVLFVMISNHFPSTFGNAQGWLILAIITVGTAGVKHWLNLREKGQLNLWVLPVSAAILLGAAFMTAPPKNPGACTGDVAPSTVQTIVQKRCMSCHSSRPTDDVYTSAPNGVMFESPQDLLKLKDKVLQRVVITKTMPQNNKTGMTEEERNQVRCWLEQGK
ncbi:urate hydroxylase PuuD [Flaviaesturariibacter amylovorans]|uniref:Urate hydroxylase PuuD n=1 Tax=Flaviaesturariibacter amylovorans TaxID=1084520 RepID=A0ABP8GZ72_9BACT